MIYLYSILGMLLFVPLSALVTWGIVPALFCKNSSVPKDLQGNHDDWWWPLRWVPRRWLIGLNDISSRHRYPKQLLGNNRRVYIRVVDGKVYPVHDWKGRPVLQQDVPGDGYYWKAGYWCLSWPLNFAWVFSLFGNWWLLRLGLRKDYNNDCWVYGGCLHKEDKI